MSPVSRAFSLPLLTLQFVGVVRISLTRRCERYFPGSAGGVDGLLSGRQVGGGVGTKLLCRDSPQSIVVNPAQEGVSPPRPLTPTPTRNGRVVFWLLFSPIHPMIVCLLGKGRGLLADIFCVFFWSWWWFLSSLLFFLYECAVVV